MSALWRLRAARRRSGQRGQVIVLFAIALVAMLAMAALVFDGAASLLARRQLQNAADAAALAGANLVQTAQPGDTPGCATASGAVRQVIVDAVRNSVGVNLPGFDPSRITITCPSGTADHPWKNTAVRVNLSETSASYFGGIVGQTGIGVGASATAVNGQFSGLKFSVLELDPYHANWSNNTNGCPSVQFKGTNTVIFDGSLQINSACPAAQGGALNLNSNSGTVQFTDSNSLISVVGDYVPGPHPITPTPLSQQPAVPDPFEFPPIAWQTWAAQGTNKSVKNGDSVILEPGRYDGGIAVKGTAYLHPGIYVMNGGGFSVTAGGAVYSIPASIMNLNDARAATASRLSWESTCLPTNCGVLIFNTSLNSSQDQINVQGGASLMLRPYTSTADGTGVDQLKYQNLLIWQDKSPQPTINSSQPDVALQGGGQVEISGTVYAPSAVVQMGGSSGGTGGDVDVTLQFVSWDLQFNGSVGFHFFYQNDRFAQPTDYGLVQ